MQRFSIIVKATWDDEASVWVAETDDIQGLSTEAETLEALRDKVLVMIRELLELNGSKSDLPEILYTSWRSKSLAWRDPCY